MHELRDQPEPRLPELLAQMSPVDLVLVEGFKQERHPKIEIFRQVNAKPHLYPDDRSIIAIAADVALHGLAIPMHHLDDIEGIANVVETCAMPVNAIEWGDR
jgi:molybdopterin-guanine dinucleotide biosynthesis protein B